MSDESHAYTGLHHKADWENKFSRPLNNRPFMTIDTGCPKVQLSLLMQGRIHRGKCIMHNPMMKPSCLCENNMPVFFV